MQPRTLQTPCPIRPVRRWPTRCGWMSTSGRWTSNSRRELGSARLACERSTRRCGTALSRP